MNCDTFMTRTKKLQLLLTCSLPVSLSLWAQINPNGNPGDWSDLVTTLPAPITSVATGGPGGGAYTQIYNVDNEYSSTGAAPAGWGSGPYSLFGAPGPNYSYSFGNHFYQSIDVYINTSWAPGTLSPSSAGFWIDMSPASSSSDPNSPYYDEHDFAFMPNGSGQVLVGGDDFNLGTIATISTSGWYDFQMTYQPGATMTDPVVNSLNVYSDATHALLGSAAAEGNDFGDVLDGNDLSGSGYVWLTVWQDGFAGDSLDVANVDTASVPDTACTFSLLGVGVGALAGLRRRFNRA
jgi:hypothetical protein